MAIMQRLQDVILERADLIHDVVETSAELDCILALGSCAKELELTRPNILDRNENIVKIVGGRHPLQALCVNQFVKNDTNLSDREGKMKIITGPNASGKSVYIKQVGLIVYLIHIGSFVPAEHADVSIKDGLFTRIHTNESVSVPLSTFMIDLDQVSNAVANATKHSCVIIDEFGKGTAAVDGLALLYATLKYWLDRKEDAPCVLVSTHFHHLKELIVESDVPLYQTMDIMKTDEEIIYLYQLKDGFVDMSYASQTAKSACIPQPIIERATQICESIKNHKPITKRSSETNKDEESRLVQIVDEFLQKDLDVDALQSFLKSIL